MIYGSVCSGIEAATVAWHPLGWEAAFFSEIEKFPSGMLAHHYPNTPNLGDMTKFKDWPDANINVLVGGTPCQSFSVAGLRKGLDDPRGNLMLTFGAIAAKYRPQWLVWENVPGVLSSDGGRDFGTFLGMLGELGYGFAYRVLDAQYAGLAQRRKRVFVVGCLGDWRSAAAVLIERHSLSGNPAPSREKGQGFAADTAPCLTGSGRGVERTGESLGQDPVVAVPKAGWPADVAPTPNAHYGGGYSCPDVANPLTARMHKGINTTVDEGQTPIVITGGAFDEVVSIRTAQTSSNGCGINTEGTAYTPDGANGQAVLYSIMPQNSGKEYKARRVDVSQPLMAGGAVGGNQGGDVVQSAMSVRRLTTKECSRLQGFPDDYLELKYADADEANAAQILHELWREIGAKGISAKEACFQDNRGGDLCEKRRVAISLFTPQILLAGVYVGWVLWDQARRSAECQNKQNVGKTGWTEGFVRRLREAGASGCPPYRRESFEQLARELGVPLSELSLEAAQSRQALRNSRVWKEAQRTWPLRYALATEKENGSGKPLMPDGPRYKALGNSMAVPCMRWIGERIEMVEAIRKEAAA